MFLDYLIPRWLTYAIYLFLLVTPAMMPRFARDLADSTRSGEKR
jgi:hypothetical protein